MELEYWKATSEMSPEPGVCETLEALSSCGIPMAVVSNSMFTADVLRWELERHGMFRWFAFVMSSADYAFKKPHASIFRAALRRLQQQPGSAWFVGDSLANDVAGASGVGMTAVWYNRRQRECEEPLDGHEIRTWDELLFLVEALP